MFPFTLLMGFKIENKSAIFFERCMPNVSLYHAGQSPVFSGRSGKQLKRRHSSQRGMLLDDWSRIVKNLNVSSSVNQASRLIDGSEQCWQSSGSQGKVTLSPECFILVYFMLKRISPEPSHLQAEQPQLSWPVLIGEVIYLSNCFCGPLLTHSTRSMGVFCAEDPRAGCSSPGGVSQEQSRGGESPPLTCWLLLF